MRLILVLQPVQSPATILGGWPNRVMEVDRSASHRHTSGNFGGSCKYPGSVTVLFCNLKSSAKLQANIIILVRMDNDVVVLTNAWKNTKEAVANFRRLLLCSKW